MNRSLQKIIGLALLLAVFFTTAPLIASAIAIPGFGDVGRDELNGQTTSGLLGTRYTIPDRALLEARQNLMNAISQQGTSPDPNWVADLAAINDALTVRGYRNGELITPATPGAVTPEEQAAAASRLAGPPECGWSEIHCMFMRFMASVASWMVWVVEWGVRVANWVFNQAVNLSVRELGNLAESDAVNKAWGIARDLVNIALVFVLLYIAGSIILQTGANDKRLVMVVVIIALLVNFSAFLTKIVIDISNVAANEFYVMSGADSETGAPSADGGAPDIATQLNRGFHATAADIKIGEDKILGQDGRGQAYLAIVSASAGQIILNLITGVVLIAGAVMMVARTVILVFLIILSPLAFFFYILPGTKGYFDKWKKKLIDQSLFAPAFLLMFYVTVNLAKAGPIANMGREPGDFGFAQSLLYVMIVNGMMVASLIIAKTFGAYGAEAGLGYTKRIGSFVRGAAYGSTIGLAGRGARFAGRGIRNEALQAVSRLEAGRTREGKTSKLARFTQPLISRIPGLRGQMQKAGMAYRGTVAARTADFEKLRTGEMKRRLRSSRTTSTTKRAILAALAKKGDLDELRREEVQEIRDELVAAGMSTNTIDRYRPDAARTMADIEKGVSQHKAGDVGIDKLHRVVVSGPNKDQVVDAMIKHYDGGTVNNIMRRGDAISEILHSTLMKRAGQKAVAHLQSLPSLTPDQQDELNELIARGGEPRQSHHITKYLDDDVLQPVLTEINRLKALTTRTTEEDEKLERLETQSGKIRSHIRSYNNKNTLELSGLDQYRWHGQGPRRGGGPTGGPNPTTGGGTGGAPTGGGPAGGTNPNPTAGTNPAAGGGPGGRGTP